MQKKNFFLLLHAQDVGGVSLYKRNRYSSSFTISEWKESFIRKSLPTLILASAFPEEQKIIFFFYNLRVEGDFHQKIFACPDILLLLHSQSGRGDSLENLCPPRYQPLHIQKKKKYSSSSTFSEWKGSFIRKNYFSSSACSGWSRTTINQLNHNL